MQPFFDQASPLDKIRTNRHISELRRRGARGGGPKMQILESELMMYGVTNSNIKEKLGMTMGGGGIPELTRQKITFQVTGEDSIY